MFGNLNEQGSERERDLATYLMILRMKHHHHAESENVVVVDQEALSASAATPRPDHPSLKGVRSTQPRWIALPSPSFVNTPTLPSRSLDQVPLRGPPMPGPAPPLRGPIDLDLGHPVDPGGQGRDQGHPIGQEGHGPNPQVGTQLHLIRNEEDEIETIHFVQ